MMDFRVGDCFDFLDNEEFIEKYRFAFRLIILDPPWNKLKPTGSPLVRKDDFLPDDKKEKLPEKLVKFLAENGTILIETSSVFFSC